MSSVGNFRALIARVEATVMTHDGRTVSNSSIGILATSLLLLFFKLVCHIILLRVLLAISKQVKDPKISLSHPNNIDIGFSKYSIH